MWFLKFRRWVLLALLSLIVIPFVLIFVLNLFLVVSLPVYRYRIVARDEDDLVCLEARGLWDLCEFWDFITTFRGQDTVDFRFWYVWDPNRPRVLHSEDEA